MVAVFKLQPKITSAATLVQSSVNCVNCVKMVADVADECSCSSRNATRIQAIWKRLNFDKGDLRPSCCCCRLHILRNLLLDLENADQIDLL